MTISASNGPAVEGTSAADATRNGNVNADAGASLKIHAVSQVLMPFVGQAALLKESAQLYTYPIKSFRPVSVQHATLTRHGFPYDRRYMLLRRGADGELENMHVTRIPAMSLFTTSLQIPDERDLSTATVGIAWTSPSNGEQDTLRLPLDPDHNGLDTVTVDMHQSATVAHVMPAEACDWLSARFGFEVLLVHLGLKGKREVLGNLTPDAATRNPRLAARQTASASAWASGAFGRLSKALTPWPLAGSDSEDQTRARQDEHAITFADCAPYLIVSSTSVDNVSARLPPGVDMDVTKFRPNIVVSGAPSAFEEDRWAELSIVGPCRSDKTEGAVVACTQNCLRCPSLNVDYATGDFHKNIHPLKLLQKDRRVDGFMKYNACFGRYSFLLNDRDTRISVGDDVAVTKRNNQPTAFKWPGMGSLSKDDRYAL